VHVRVWVVVGMVALGGVACTSDDDGDAGSAETSLAASSAAPTPPTTSPAPVTSAAPTVASVPTSIVTGQINGREEQVLVVRIEPGADARLDVAVGQVLDLGLAETGDDCTWDYDGEPEATIFELIDRDFLPDGICVFTVRPLVDTETALRFTNDAEEGATITVVASGP